MKQSNLDIAMNICLDALYNNSLDGIDNINKSDVIDRLEILNNVRLFFINYDKTIGGVEQEKIEHFNDTHERTR